MSNSCFCGGAGGSAVSLARCREVVHHEGVPCRHHLRDDAHHRRGGRSMDTPSWRITEVQDGSLCWVPVKTRPSPRVLPPKNAASGLTPGARRAPADPRREPPKIVGGPGGRVESQGRPAASAVGTAMEENTSGRPERASPPWCLDPRTRHEGPWPAGVHGASGYAPWQARHPPGWLFKELTSSARHGDRTADHPVRLRRPPLHGGESTAKPHPPRQVDVGP